MAVGVDGCAAERKERKSLRSRSMEQQNPQGPSPVTWPCGSTSWVPALFRHPFQEEPPGLALLTHDPDRLGHSQPNKRCEHTWSAYHVHGMPPEWRDRSVTICLDYREPGRLWGWDPLAMMETCLKLEVPPWEPRLWARPGRWVPAPGLGDGQLCHYTTKPCK